MTNSQNNPWEEYEALWKDLAEHLVRDALVIVKGNLSLLNAAEAIAKDETTKVSNWIANGALGKPTPEQLKLWNQTPEKLFQCMIVQPYVLIKELSMH